MDEEVVMVVVKYYCYNQSSIPILYYNIITIATIMVIDNNLHIFSIIIHVMTMILNYTKWINNGNVTHYTYISITIYKTLDK